MPKNIDIEKYKLAGSIHNRVRTKLMEYLRPGINTIDICHFIENEISVLSEQTGQKHLNNSILFFHTLF